MFVFFLGVTCFDGLIFERRATRRKFADRLTTQTKILAKTTLASVKSPYFGMSDFAFAYARA